MGLSFEPPNVNRGNYRFEPIRQAVIRYGLGAIKGTGEQAIEAIVAAREGRGKGPTERWAHSRACLTFARRVDRSRLNKRTVEALIKAGAFDTMHLNRAALVASIGPRFDFAAPALANANQGGLFDMGATMTRLQHPGARPGGGIALGHQGAPDAGKDGRGFLLSGHLFDEVTRPKCAALPNAPLTN
jgi:DNA polymerase-3 subunit alpha